MFFFSSRRRHTRWTGDWSSDVCSSDLAIDSVGLCAREESRVASAKAYGVDGAEKGSVELPAALFDQQVNEHLLYQARSEERRVGKECRSRWSADHVREDSE